nr:rRNA methyltransferase 2, mitochondrial-like [Quercus suber]
MLATSLRTRLQFRAPTVPFFIHLTRFQPISPPHFLRSSSSSSSTRWKSRQSSDPYTRASKLAGLKSRAAYKLLDIHARHHLFSRGDTVVDLGFAPGSWSQVALSKVQAGGSSGRVVGIDVIPAQPPRGVSTLQGDFLSEGIRQEVRRFVREGSGQGADGPNENGDGNRNAEDPAAGDGGGERQHVVDVVLSDMSAPWPLATGPWLRSVNRPYLRMMNTSGIAFKDHAGSMDLCLAALEFAYDTLRPGGHFLCKFYQGAEDGALERRLKSLFAKVHRIKPDSSRKESREAYLVGLKRKEGVEREAVLGD